MEKQHYGFRSSLHDEIVVSLSDSEATKVRVLLLEKESDYSDDQFYFYPTDAPVTDLGGYASVEFAFYLRPRKVKETYVNRQPNVSPSEPTEAELAEENAFDDAARKKDEESRD